MRAARFIVVLLLIAGRAYGQTLEPRPDPTREQANDQVQPTAIDDTLRPVAPPEQLEEKKASDIGADTVRLGLRQAIDDGVKSATEILKAQNQTEITGADLMRAYGAFLPNVATNASYGFVDGKTPSAVGSGIFDARYREGGYQISSTLNIFKGFGDQSFLNASDHRKTASVYTLDRARQLIALDISQAFWQVILDQELVLIAQKNLDISQSRQHLFSEQRKVGSLNAADLYRQIAQTSSDQSALIDARNRAQIDLLFLIRRLRLDAKQSYVLETPPAEVPTTPHLIDEKFMINHALRERFDLRAQKNETEATAWDVQNARHTYFPQLDLTGAFSGDARTYSGANLAGVNELTGPQRSMVGQLGDQTEGSIMLTLTWQPFDRLVTPANVRVAKANESNAEIDLSDTSNQVVVEVTSRSSMPTSTT